MFLWALCFPLITYGLSAAPPLGFATMRALIAGVSLLIVANYKRRPPLRGRNHWSAVVLVGLSATTLGFAGMFYGGARVAPGLATVVGNAQPLFAAVLLAWLGQELLSRAQCLGLLVGFGGIVLIGVPGLGRAATTLPGLGLILLGALGVAASNVILSRMAGRIDTLRAMGWQLVVGSIPLGVMSAIVEQPGEILWSWGFVGALLALSLLGTAAAFVGWFELLRRGSLNQLNVFTFFTPVFGLAMGVAFFGETLSILTGIGILFCLISVLWLSIVAPGSSPQPLQDPEQDRA